jgi:hypothetical protein
MNGSHLAELALCSDHRSAGDGNWLAPKAIPLVLEMEIGFGRSGRDSRTDSSDGPRQPTLGSTFHGELLQLCIDVGANQRWRIHVARKQPPSQTWRTFLENHIKSMASIDFFGLPTIDFRVVYVFVVLLTTDARSCISA